MQPDKEQSPSVTDRFFIDHGMIHDRATGKHVSTEPVEFEEGQFDASPTLETCALLNSLAHSAPDLGKDEELLEQAEARIDEAADAMIAERKAEYGAKFSASQEAAIKVSHYQQKLGARVAAAIAQPRLEALLAEREKLRGLLARVTDAAENLAGELTDPGTEALSAIYCARAALSGIAQGQS